MDSRLLAVLFQLFRFDGQPHWIERFFDGVLAVEPTEEIDAPAALAAKRQEVDRFTSDLARDRLVADWTLRQLDHVVLTSFGASVGTSIRISASCLVRRG